MNFSKEINAQGKKLNIQNEADFQRAVEENPHLRKMWDRLGRLDLKNFGQKKLYFPNRLEDPCGSYASTDGGKIFVGSDSYNTNSSFYQVMQHEFRHQAASKFGMNFLSNDFQHRFMYSRDNWNSKFFGDDIWDCPF